jgi:hypothetical protein
LRVSIQTLWLPKAGNTFEEYEDAFSPKRQGELDGESFRFAVADGATESSFSRLWARMLVRSYTSSPLTSVNLRRRVERRSRAWLRKIAALPLPWFAEEKVRQGAFSTLLGLSLEADNAASSECGRWTALAVGDSCLFQVRGAELVTCFPIERADQFGYHPLLISSHLDRNQAIWERVEQLEQTGQWEAGDSFLLTTDALGQWFLSQVEGGKQPWLTLAGVAARSQLLSSCFGEWVSEMRASGVMRNDDVTLLMIRMGGDHETSPDG